MTETTHNPLPDLLRRLMLSWLAAAALEYLLLPLEDALRALTFENAKEILRGADTYLRAHRKDLLS